MLTRRLVWVLRVCVITALLAIHMIPLVPVDPETLSLLAANGAELERRPAPPLNVVTPSGDTTNLDDFPDRLTYVNYWAQWCEPCLDEMPTLDRFAGMFGDRINVLAVASNDAPADVFRYIEQAFPSGTHFQVLLDLDGEVGHSYGNTGVPETYLISPDGDLIASWIGPRNFMAESQIELALHLLAQWE